MTGAAGEREESSGGGAVVRLCLIKVETITIIIYILGE